MPDWIRSLLLKVFRGHNGDKPLRVIERECEEATGKVRERTETIRKRRQSLTAQRPAKEYLS